MWWFLVFSILREKVNLVLEGDLEFGLYCYMLGIAIVKLEWCFKIFVVVYVDFFICFYFVEKE